MTAGRTNHTRFASAQAAEAVESAKLKESWRMKMSTYAPETVLQCPHCKVELEDAGKIEVGL